MRDILLYFAVKYSGCWERIYQAFAEREVTKIDDINKVKSENPDNWITLIDENYPEEFKYVIKPPFVIFLKGNKKLLTRFKNKFIMLNNFYGDANLDWVKKDFNNDEWKDKINNSVFMIDYSNQEIIESLLELNANIIAVNTKCDGDIKKEKLYKRIIKSNNLVISYGLDNLNEQLLN